MGSAVIETLAAADGAAKIRTDDATLREHRHDDWGISHPDVIQGRPAAKPACVVQPDPATGILREDGTGLSRTLDQALDPTGFVNPGVLIPDA